MKTFVIAALALFVAASAQAGGDAERGKQKAAQICAACHGAEGNKPSAPDQPILAGQYPDYLRQALSDYKSGKRENPIMKGFASALTEQDIEDLAEWFSSQQTPLHNQR